MKTITTVAAVMMLLTLSACAAITEKMEEGKDVMMKEVAGVDATECFTAGGTIDSSGESSMCMMSDGSSKPIL